MDIQNIFLHIPGKRCPMSPHQSRIRTKSSVSRGPWAEELGKKISSDSMKQQVINSLNQHTKECNKIQLLINHEDQTTNRQ